MLTKHFFQNLSMIFVIFFTISNTILNSQTFQVINGTQYYDKNTCLTLTDEGDIISAGMSKTSDGTNSLILTRLSQSGNIIWTRLYSNIAIENIKEIEKTDINKYTIIGSYKEGMFIAQINENGDILTKKRIKRNNTYFTLNGEELRPKPTYATRLGSFGNSIIALGNIHINGFIFPTLVSLSDDIDSIYRFSIINFDTTYNKFYKEMYGYDLDRIYEVDDQTGLHSFMGTIIVGKIIDKNQVTHAFITKTDWDLNHITYVINNQELDNTIFNSLDLKSLNHNHSFYIIGVKSSSEDKQKYNKIIIVKAQIPYREHSLQITWYKELVLQNINSIEPVSTDIKLLDDTTFIATGTINNYNDTNSQIFILKADTNGNIIKLVQTNKNISVNTSKLRVNNNSVFYLTGGIGTGFNSDSYYLSGLNSILTCDSLLELNYIVNNNYDSVKFFNSFPPFSDFMITDAMLDEYFERFYNLDICNLNGNYLYNSVNNSLDDYNKNSNYPYSYFDVYNYLGENILSNINLKKEDRSINSILYDYKLKEGLYIIFFKDDNLLIKQKKKLFFKL